MTDLPCLPVSDPILEALELESGSAYVISRSLQLTYTNSAWSRFATSNGAPFLASVAKGSLDVLQATSAPLRPYYRAAFARLLAGEEAWTHVYECSSSALFRIFAMDVYSLPDHAGLIVTNSLVVERAHNPDNREPHLGVVSTYAQEGGLIIQCAHCRRIQRPGAPDSWDWVPVWVEARPLNLGHGLCHPCFQHHYGSPVGLETSVEASAELLCKMDVRL
jgi:hypothetical protein